MANERMANHKNVPISKAIIRLFAIHHLFWRMIWSILGLLLMSYLALAALLFFGQERLIYFPSQSWLATPAQAGIPYEEIWLESADGVKLSGWFVPAESSRGVILFFHGNGGNISHRLESLALFHRLGWSTFIIDYRGYGQSEGRPGEQGTYLDAEAAWRYLLEEKRVRPEQIVIFGESLGGAVAAWLAQTHSPQALILLSTFTSVPDMGAQTYPFLPIRLLARVHYNTLARLPEITCPVLIIHSPDDEVVPYSHGQKLFGVAREPKEFLKLRGGHNEGVLLAAAEYEAGLIAFFDQYGGR